MVLQSLEKNQLYCKPSKCQFGATEILFLGHRVSGFSIGPDSEKVKAVADWPVPRSVSDVRKFLGFANYFRRFIDHYSSISRSLEEATGKNTRFVWNESRQHAFEQLKKALMQAPVLSLANVDQPFRIHTDASDFAVAGVLLQEVNSCWCPVAYASRSLSPAERNYTASERETVAVIYALQTWRMYLFKHFDLFTDNMGVVYLRTKPNLTRREARWVELLADYDFTCHHQSGKTNVADALSRRPDYDCQINALEYSLDVNSELAQSISAGYVNDPDLSPVIQRLNTSREDTLHDRYTWNSRTQQLYLTSSGQRRLCIPKGPIRPKLMQDHHDCLIAGHQGRDRTYLKLSRHFYWPGMSRSIQQFVKTCDRCQRVKGSRVKAALLQSLPVPEQPWWDISMDFIMGLPLTARGNSAILTFVDRLTKQVHLIPTNIQVDAKETARIYIDRIFSLHGLSKSIVCDRDPRFISAFFQELFTTLGTNIKMSTAHHPQTDGQTERMNRIVEDVLRIFVNHRQDNWDQLLPLCEFSMNDSSQASTDQTPFFLNYGQHPLTPSSFLNLSSSSVNASSSTWLQARLDAIKIARDTLTAAQARQALYADRCSSEDKFKVNDQVLVHRDFLLTCESKDSQPDKFRLKWYGPFVITQQVAPNAFRLQLPHTIKSHPVFNVAALKLYHANQIPGRTVAAPPSVTDMQGFTRYIVEEILSHRSGRDALTFL